MGSSPPGSEEQKLSAQSCVIFDCDSYKNQTGIVGLGCREGTEHERPMEKIKAKELNTLHTSYSKESDKITG